MAARSNLYDELLHRVDLVATVAADIELRQVGREYEAHCPFHNEKTPSFKVIPAKGFWHCFGCGQSGDAIDWVEKMRGLSHRDAVRELSTSVGLDSGTETPSARIGSFGEVWRRTDPAGRHVLTYLRSRGFELTTPPAVLRQLDSLAYIHDNQHVGDFPAIIAPVYTSMDATDPIGVHRTYLAPDGNGKAEVPVAKKCMGKMAGGFIPIQQPHESRELALAEGIEDAMAISMATGSAVWATISANNMAKVVGAIPANVTALRIFADNDRAGRDAAEATAAAWRKVRGPAADVVTVYPSTGKDVNDMYRAGGAEAVRAALSDALAVAALTAPTVLNAAEWLQSDACLAMPEPLIRKFLDAGSKCLIAGASKARKSFFALELAMSLAGKRKTFVGLDLATSDHRVLMIQPEIHEAHYQQRCRNAFYSIFGPKAKLADTFGDRLAIRNCRGENVCAMLHDGTIEQYAIDHQAQVILLDPVYKFLETGAEDSEDFRGFLSALDKVAESTGAAIIYVHHFAKGTAGDRSTIDRGAGSGWLARDFDAALFLTAHKREDKDLLVLEPIARNYAAQPARTIRWDSFTGRFERDETIPAEAKSSARGRAAKNPDLTDDELLKLFAGKDPMPSSEARQIVEKAIGRDKGRTAYKRLIDAGKLKTSDRENRTQPLLVGVEI